MRKAVKRIIALTLVIVCLLAYIPKTHAAQIPTLPDDLFLTQNVSGTCTLCSAAMMIRSSMYLHGNSNWTKVTENGLRSDAWISGTGLRWSFSHTVGNTAVQVGHQNVSGMTVESLQALLQVHPEGIVLYCGKLPHAVFLTGYDGDVFYCADTVKGISGQQIMLKDSWLGIKYGSQAAILKAVTAYWYITEYTENGHSLSCACSTDYAGIYKATSTPIQLRIRAGHGKSYSVLSSIPYGAEVKVLKASGQTKDDWAHVIYNGVLGYSSMEFLERVGQMGTVNIDVLNIRAKASVDSALVGQVAKDTRLQILEIKQEGGTRWGRIEKGWVCLDYVKLDSEEMQTPIATGTVTGLLNIRAEAGTQYSRVGQLQAGTKLEFYEFKQVGTSSWGRIDRGWVLMDYVKLDGEETETPIATGTVTIDVLNIRADTGTQYARVGQLKRGARLEIFEIRQVGDTQWGRINSGWVSLDYVELDDAEETPETITGTVNVNGLRIRSSAGTSADVVGYYYEGDQVEILETTVVEGVTWGRTDKGWISMDYVS